MDLNQILELSMELDSTHFQKAFERYYNGNAHMDESGKEYIDRSLSSNGITITYRDSQYKKKIKLTVNTYLFLDDTSDTERMIRKLDKRITEYFSHKYQLDDFILSGMHLVLDIDVGGRPKVFSYMKVFQRIGRVKGFSPASYECLDDNASFCLSGNSNGIDFLVYDLERAAMRQPKRQGTKQEKPKSIKGILRAETRLTKPKAIRGYTDACNVSGQIEELSKSIRDIFMDTFTRIVPFGDFYKKDKADEIIRREVSDSIMRRRMLRLLALIPQKKSLYLAQKSMNCRDVDKVMKAFSEINVSPVTISKRHDVKHLENIYGYILD